MQIFFPLVLACNVRNMINLYTDILLLFVLIFYTNISLATGHVDHEPAFA